MDVREKLVELQMQAKIGWTKEEFADYLIAKGVTVQEWISVKDRLPTLDEPVLVFAVRSFIKTRHNEVWSLFRRHSGELIWVDKFGDGHKLTEVTHWMPLPEPPKGE